MGDNFFCLCPLHSAARYAGFVQVQHMLGARLQPDYGSGLCLDDADLQTAAHVYGQWLADAEEHMLKLMRLMPEPLLQCFICHKTTRTQLNDGACVVFSTFCFCFGIGTAAPSMPGSMHSQGNLQHVYSCLLGHFT